MKLIRVLSITLLSLNTIILHASIGKDMVGGIATGTVALGSFYLAKNEITVNAKPIADEQALAIAGLAGLVMTAVVQANLKDSGIDDVIAHLLTGLASFGLMKYLADSLNQASLIPTQPEASVPAQD